MSSLLREAREGTENYLCGRKSALKKLSKFKRVNNIEASKVLCSKVFQISGLSMQQFILRQILVFRSSAKVIIIFA